MKWNETKFMSFYDYFCEELVSSHVFLWTRKHGLAMYFEHATSFLCFGCGILNSSYKFHKRDYLIYKEK